MGGRAAAAAFYPMALITEILRGIRDTEDAEHDHHECPHDPDVAAAMCPVALCHDVPKSLIAYISEENLANDNKKRFTKFHCSDGSMHTVPLHEHFKEQYRDEYTNEILPRSWVEAAIQVELNYFNENVWTGVPLQDALNDPDGKLVGCRWVVCNKNDINSPDIRARLVAQEVSTHADTSFYAATPPSRKQEDAVQWMGDEAYP